MVEDAQDKKTKTQKFLEKFSKYYTPGIIVLSQLDMSQETLSRKLLNQK